MIRAKRLQCEYLKNPVGLDRRELRLSWIAEGAVRQSAVQLRYQKNEGGWIFGEKQVSEKMHLRFPISTESRDRVLWQIRLRDENGMWGDWSEEAFFEMGFLDGTNWQAKWIMGDYVHSPKPEKRYPTDCFRKIFHIPEEQIIKRARFYVTACGMYEAHLDGERIGDRMFAPGSTAFQKRVHYQVYDVTDLLRKKQNKSEHVLELELADGFYASKTGCFDHAKIFGYEPKLLAQLEIFYVNGSCTVIGSDETFAWCNDGPRTYADLKDGETVDFAKKPSYGGQAKVTEYGGSVCADNNVKVVEKEVFCNPEIFVCPDGNTVLDFKQNLAGYVEFCVTGGKGSVARMVLGEKLDENGNFTISNISLSGDYMKNRFQSLEFVCDGTRHVYKPKFAVMGFRYALLLEWPEKILSENFRAIAVYSDMPVTGYFSCSDEGINRIVQNTLWSMKGNFLDVPTDCPTRERAGWTGDAQLFFETGNFLMDQRAFFEKWMRDVADCQRKDGMVYNINPVNPKGNRLMEWLSVEGGVGWGDAFLMIPYYYWKRYGDDRLIRIHWKAMKRCFSFYEKRIGKRNLFSLFFPKRGKHSKYLCACGRDFGEWTEPADCAPNKMSLLFPHPEEGTAYVAYDAGLMGEMASHLGEKEESVRYLQQSEHVAEAYRYYFLGDGDFKTKRMAKYARPCGLGLVKNELREKLLQNIVKLNREREYAVGTGFLSTAFVLPLLTEAGASEDAYRMLTNPKTGWMKQINEGATSIWENWTSDASLNHYSKGACCQWLFDCVCGIKLDERENHFVIAPHPVPQLTRASFAYDSAYGMVKSSWEKMKNGYHYEIVVPANTCAEVYLPGGKVQQLSAGDYTFEEGETV